jgi:hypothetical protein
MSEHESQGHEAMMATYRGRYADLFAALAAPFETHEVKIRAAAGGRQLHYITARTAMNRLDNVIGPINWWDEYVPGANSVMCRLTIRLPDGSTLTKVDAGGYAGMADQGDDDKSGFSDAFKRACAKFGVARYLYRDGVPNYAMENHGEVPGEPAGRPQERSPAGGQYDRAIGRQDAPRGRQEAQTRQERPQSNQSPAAPRSGRALFAWTKEQEQRHEVGLLKYINNWGKLQDFPGRMIDWDEEQVRLAYAEAMRKLTQVGNGPQEPHEEAMSN